MTETALMISEDAGSKKEGPREAGLEFDSPGNADQAVLP